MNNINNLLKSLLYLLKALLCGQIKTNILSIKHTPEGTRQTIYCHDTDVRYELYTNSCDELFAAYIKAGYKMSRIRFKKMKWEYLICLHPINIIPSCKEPYLVLDVIFPKSVIEIGSNLFCYAIGSKEIQLPAQLKRIESNAFITSNEYIELPDSLECIGDRAFIHCSFKRISIPASVRHIGVQPFNSSTEVIIVDSRNPVYDSRENCNAIIEKSTNKLIYASRNSKIPNGIKSIGEFAFNPYTRHVIIPTSVTYIHRRAFANLHTSELIIPTGVTEIEEYAFEHSSIGKIAIPNTITHISKGTFACCKTREIVIPEGVIEIEEGAFHGAEIKTITLPDSVIRIKPHAFSYCTTDKITIPPKIREIEEGVFKHSKINNIILHDNIRQIHSQAFAGCITGEINITNHIDKIMLDAFIEISVRKLTFSNSQQFVNQIFRDSNIGELVLPMNMDTIHEETFNSANIEYLLVPDTVRHICKGAFRNSTLGIIRIDAPISIIEDETFSGASIQEIILPSTLREIGKKAFLNSKLESITIPDGVTKIAEQAFRLCKGLKEIELPATITYIGSCAFSEIASLKRIKTPVSALVEEDFVTTIITKRYGYGYQVDKIMTEGDNKYKIYEQWWDTESF